MHKTDAGFQCKIRKAVQGIEMEKDTVTFICPRCSQAVSVEMPAYPHGNQSMKVDCRCACGYQFTRDVERRRHNRKAVKCPGWYSYSNEIQLEPGVVAGKFVGKGKMTVVDLSVSGFKVKLKKKEDLKINDRLQVEFFLKDYKRTLIRETAAIKNIHQKYIGGDLGFYLLG